MSTPPEPPPHALTRTVAFLNQKGGVGKTTTTVNLAAAIAETGRRTLIVDMDPQAHATIHLGVEPAADHPSAYDGLLDPDRASDAVVHARPNLAVIPAEVDLAAAETELSGEHDRNDRLRRGLAPLRENFEFIFIDCPPSLGLLTLNALAAAREVVVPMQAHFLALQGVGKLLETVRIISQGVNADIRVSGIVLCAHDEQTRHAREVVADLEEFFDAAREQAVPWRGARVYQPPIRRHIKLAECPSFGQTIFEYAPGLAGAQDYHALAGHFLAEWDLMLERRRQRLGEHDQPGAGKPDVVVTSAARDQSRAAGA
jgi:chromosome partitioning protein